MRKTIILPMLIAFVNITYAQNLQWAVGIGAGGDEVSESIDIDALGNVYTTGRFEDTVDFDPGPNTFNLISNGDTDIFIQKLGANGNFIWAKSMGGSSSDESYSLTIDSSGNVYTTGTYNGTVDFDPSMGTTNLTATGNNDIFIQKLDANGNFIWAKTMGSDVFGGDVGYSIATDGDYLYTTGWFNGTVDFDPGLGSADTFYLTTTNSDIFIQKLDTNGNFVWAKSMGSFLTDKGYSITVDNSGNVYTTGMFSGTVDFDPGSSVSNLSANGGTNKRVIFVQKLDANGDFLWAKSMGNNANNTTEVGYSIKVDGSGNVYTTGHFRDTVDFDPGAGTSNLISLGFDDIFIQKLNTNGDFLWAKSMGSTSIDQGLSIALDNSGNVYASGYFQDTVDFDPGAGTSNLISNGVSDIFIQKFDTNGNFIWAKSMGGIDDDKANSLALDSAGYIYISGYFYGTIDFDPNTTTNLVSSNGRYDAFTLKLGQTTSSSNEILKQFVDVKVYPNPVSDLINIDLGELESSTIRLLDVNGRSLKTIINTNGITTINTKNLASGIYFVELSYEKSKQYFKVVKQ